MVLNPLDPQSGYTATFANVTASGDTQLVAAVAGQRIYVLWAFADNKGSSVITIHLRSNDTPITSDKDLAADGGGFTMDVSQGYYCRTAVGEALDINMSGAGTVGLDYGYYVAG